MVQLWELLWFVVLHLMVVVHICVAFEYVEGLWLWSVWWWSCWDASDILESCMDVREVEDGHGLGHVYI